MLTRLMKRSGEVVFFDNHKIEEAVYKALHASPNLRRKQEHRRIAQVVADYVSFELEKKYDESQLPTVEDIQDVVETVLMRIGEYDTARRYIKYRYEHKLERDIEHSALDMLSLFDEYLGQRDWTVKENSNMDYSLQGLNNHVVAKASATFWLNSVYPEALRQAHLQGDLHIHDLGLLSTYCCGWSLEDLLRKGFGGAKGKVESGPAKHFETALMQLVNFIYTLQGEAAGAQAVSNFDTLLAPFIYFDRLTYLEVKQCMQAFVFNMNVATRVGFQTPFFNITLDKEVPSTHENLPVIVGGTSHFDFTYKDFQKEMDWINLAFCEVMTEGDAKGRIFTFPIPTYNVTKAWDWDNEVSVAIMQMTAKYGIPYFSNFVSSDLDPEDVRSMCCRLRLDNKALIRRGGGLFGANPKTGSIGVVTINMARLGYVSENLDELKERLASLMSLAKVSLELKRRVLETNMQKGLYPYSKHYLEDIYDTHGEYWFNHFATIGPNGVNECIRNLTADQEDITTPKGKKIAEDLLDFMNQQLVSFQEETSHLYNLEASPAEGTAYRFARLDLELYPTIITAGDSTPYYTNSTQLPVGHTQDLFDALSLQDSLQTKYTGGTVFHAFLPEKLESGEVVKELLKKVMNHFELPYFTLTPTFSICPEHQYISGQVSICPKCQRETEVWTRVVGYHRPVNNWNEGKRAEFNDRKAFSDVI
jgi:anaerobic ribonucleoside-triphosphate reductase